MWIAEGQKKVRTGRTIPIRLGGFSSAPTKKGTGNDALISIFRLDATFLPSSATGVITCDDAAGLGTISIKKGLAGPTLFAVQIPNRETEGTIRKPVNLSSFPQDGDLFVYFNSSSDAPATAKNLRLEIYGGGGSANNWTAPVVGELVGNGQRSLVAGNRSVATPSGEVAAAPTEGVLPTRDYNCVSISTTAQQLYAVNMTAKEPSLELETIFPWKPSPHRQTGAISYYAEAAVVPIAQEFSDIQAPFEQGGVAQSLGFTPAEFGTTADGSAIPITQREAFGHQAPVWSFGIHHDYGGLVRGAYGEATGGQPQLVRVGPFLMDRGTEPVPKFERLRGIGDLRVLSVRFIALVEGSDDAPILTTFGDFFAGGYRNNLGTDEVDVATIEAPRIHSIGKTVNFSAAMSRPAGTGNVTATLKDAAGATITSIVHSTEPVAIGESTDISGSAMTPSATATTEELSITLDGSAADTASTLWGALLEIEQTHDQVEQGMSVVGGWSLSSYGLSTDLDGRWYLTDTNTTDIDGQYALKPSLTTDLSSRWELTGTLSTDILSTWELV